MQTQRDVEGWRPTAANPDGGPHEYAVDYLLDRKGTRPTTEYLVKWKGLRSLGRRGSHLRTWQDAKI